MENRFLKLAFSILISTFKRKFTKNSSPKHLPFASSNCFGWAKIVAEQCSPSNLLCKVGTPLPKLSKFRKRDVMYSPEELGSGSVTRGVPK